VARQVTTRSPSPGKLHDDREGGELGETMTSTEATGLLTGRKRIG